MAAKSKPSPAEPKAARESRLLSPWLVGGVGLLLGGGFVVASGFASVGASKGETILPRVKVAGHDLGGLTHAAANERLQQLSDGFLQETFVFTYTDSKGKEKKFEATAADLGLVIDVGASANVAFGVGHREQYLHSLAGQIVSAFGGTDADAVALYEATTFEAFLGTEFLPIEKPARDARLTYKDGTLSVVESKSGHEVDTRSVAAALAEQAGRLTHAPIQLALVETQPDVTADQLDATKQLATRMLSRSVTFFYKDKTYAPPKEVVGSWLEFQTVRPANVLGVAACECDLPAPRGERATEDANFSTPTMLVTATEQERRGQKAGDPYYVLLPPDNFSAGTLRPSQPLAVVGYNRSELQAWLTDNVSTELDVPGESARFAFTNGTIKVTKPSTAGTGVDLDTAMHDLVFGTSNVKLALHQTKPAITEDRIDELGITTLIGRGITDASGSPANRFVNIDVGLGKFDGMVIAPGEEFDTLKTLGPIDGVHGFLPELVITGNRIEPQYGGGLCQVSSTLFRAALDTGLDITERTNHAFVVDHYVWPYGVPGYEATIFEPAPNLKFINDTDRYILIHTYRQEDDKVVFEFYGTDPKRTTTATTPYWVSGGPVGGGTTTFHYSVTDDATGELLQDEEFVSIFQPLAKFKRT